MNNDEEKEQLREVYANELKNLGMSMGDAANLAAMSSGKHWEALKKVLWNLKDSCVRKTFSPERPLTIDQYLESYAEFRSITQLETMVEEFAEGFNRFIKEMNLIDNDKLEE